MSDTLPLYHPHPLLSTFSRLHPTQRAKRRSHRAGQALRLPNDQAGPALIDVAKQVPRPEGAIGHPAVTRLHRLEDATAQRARLGMAIFARKNVTHQALIRFIDHQRLPRESAGFNPSHLLEPMRACFKTMAIDPLDLLASEPGLAVTAPWLDQRRPLVGTRADQCCRGVGREILPFVVDRDPRCPNLRFLRPRGRMDRGLKAQDHWTPQVRDR